MWDKMADRTDLKEKLDLRAGKAWVATEQYLTFYFQGQSLAVAAVLGYLRVKGRTDPPRAYCCGMAWRWTLARGVTNLAWRDSLLSVRGFVDHAAGQVPGE